MNLPPLPDCLTHVIFDGTDGQDIVAQLRVPLVAPAIARDYGRACARAALDAALVVIKSRNGRNFDWSSEKADRYHAQADAADAIADAIRRLRDSL